MRYSLDMKVTVLFLGVLVLSAGDLFAGYVLTYRLDRYSNEGVKTQRCVETNYIDVAKMRIETVCQDPASQSLSTVSIFRGDKNLLWQIDTTSRHYTEMTRSEVQKSRKGFEEAMRSTGGHSYRPTGKTEKIKSWTCTVYHHVFHETLADEFCVAEGELVFKGAGEAETSKRHLLEMLDPMAINPEEQNQLADLAMGPSRFTLKEVNILLDQPAFIREFTEGRTAPLPPSVFELPKGATRNPAAP